MPRRLLLTCLMLALAPVAARADAADDCNRFDKPALQVKGCTRFIKSGSLDGEQLSMAYTNRGVANAALGKLEKAVGDFTEAVRLNPGNALAIYNRGNVHFDRGDMRKAITDFDLAIARDPEFPLAYFNRGIAHENLGEREPSIADYRKALELAPELKPARDRLEKLGVPPVPPVEATKPAAKPGTGA